MNTSREGTRRAAGAALGALVLSGCGGGATTTPSPSRAGEAKLPRSVSQPLWLQLDKPARVRKLTITAINAHRVPAGLQESLLSMVNAYAARPTFGTKLRLRAWLLDHGAPPTRRRSPR